MTIRDVARKQVVDVEYLTLQDCAADVQSIEDKKSSTADYQIVSYCRKK